MQETDPDLSDKTWDELYDADYSLLRKIASDVEGVPGDASREKICVGLLVTEGRADEVPEEYSDLVSEFDAEPEENTNTEKNSSDTATDDEGETDEYRSGSEYEPSKEPNYIIKAEAIQTFVTHITTIVDEAKINLNPSALKTRAVDPANVAMVDAHLDESGFESFESVEGVIGVNVERLEDVLGGANKDDSVELHVDTTARNLVVRYGSHEFTIGLIDPDSIRAEPDIPDLDLPVKATLSGDLQDAVSYADQVSDHIGFRATPESVLTISAEGDTDHYEGDFERGDIDFHSVPSKTVNSLYSLDYMKDVIKPFDASQDVTLEFGDEFPIKMSGDIEANDEKVGEAQYMIAPRIQSE